MPFVLRRVEPQYMCRGHMPVGAAPRRCPVIVELETVANGALITSLKQLASLLINAEDIFADLTSELTAVADRSSQLRMRIDKVEKRLSSVDPKKVPVPESDICTFAARTEHFHVVNKPSTASFTLNTRPKALRELYEAAAIVTAKQLDSVRRDDSSMDVYICPHVLNKRRRDQSLDIESRIPAIIEDLRRWTSAEALGDVIVQPDCMSRILGVTMDDNAVDHQLPSPEEQVQAIALKFPAEIVAVDISGKGFARMSVRRKSLLSGQESQETAVKRRSRPHRSRGKRRNTIAGIDNKEIRQAIRGETPDEDANEIIANIASKTQRSASTYMLGSSKKESPTVKKSHFNTLKAWGMSRLKLISPRSNQQQEKSETPASSTTERHRRDKSNERKPSTSSLSGKSVSSIPLSVSAKERQSNVTLRVSAVQRRERRKAGSRDDPPHSSSGNWSASSESGRASIGSETTCTTHQPRSITTGSIGTSSTSLSHFRRFKGRDTSASSSITSEGTLTPDIIQDIAVVPVSDDGETSSVYSCDAEGYYTSFHVDSGLKTLREEDPVPQCPLTKTNDVSFDLTSPVVENEYELFGRGSTSTTTSSAGTVCTALLAPLPPERKSSLTVVAMVHGQNETGGESPDSGHNTSSSPVESTSSPVCTGRSYSEFEYSESSDLEGCERIERIRSKIAINSSRIPSMCVITPPGSDDEHAREAEHSSKKTDSRQTGGSVLISATVGTSKVEVINGQDLYATVQLLSTSTTDKIAVGLSKISPLSGVLGKLRGVLPGRKNVTKNLVQNQVNADSGGYVTIADVRSNKDKLQDPGSTSDSVKSTVTCTNSDVFNKDAEYVSLSVLPKQTDSSLERKRQGARVTLNSSGKVVYMSDSLKRRKKTHTTFNPGPFLREEMSQSPSLLLHRTIPTMQSASRTTDLMDSPNRFTPPTSPQLGKLIIRAARSAECAASLDYVRTPMTVVVPTSPTPHRQVRGAYVNVQVNKDNTPNIPHGIIDPSPYISPPNSEECQKYQKIQEVLKDAQPTQTIQTQCQEQHNNGDHRHQQIRRIYDSQQNICNPNQFFEESSVENCNEYQHLSVNMHNTKNLQYRSWGKHANQQFYTLPSRRPLKDVEPPRSITPDIPRGLGHGSLSTMHIFARHGQKEFSRFGCQVDGNDKNLENFEIQQRLTQSQQQPPIVDVRNRYATSLGLTSLGYQFLTSSPVYDPVTKISSSDAIKHSPVSSMKHSDSLKTSMPSGRVTPTITENVALTGCSNCTSPVANLKKNNLVQTFFCRSTPTNLALSPTKSTMSNEELFTAIHKSKKRLNIKDDGENYSPHGSTNSLVNMSSENTQSRSSKSQRPPVITQYVQSLSPTTSRLDFKRLLLQQSVKNGPTRLSAAEQLKLSRQNLQQPWSTVQQTPLTKVLSPRSQWRFQTPRTNILSSTIIEDTAAEEKAMKPSSENTSSAQRLALKRQQNLCNNLPSHLHVIDSRNEVLTDSKDMLSLDNLKDSYIVSFMEPKAFVNTILRQDQTVSSSTCSHVGVDLQSSLTQSVSDLNSQNFAILYSFHSQLTPSPQKVTNTFESRRISCQLARAQFFADTPMADNQARNTYVRQIFSGRSESPQTDYSQNVSRTSSVSTLETAL